MSRRKVSIFLVIAAICAMIAGVLGVVWHIEGPKHLTFSQSFIQAKLDSKLGENGLLVPRELLEKKHVNLLGVRDVNVKNIQIDLTGDQIGLLVTAVIVELNKEYVVTARTAGDLRYESGAFFFSPTQVALVSVVTPDTFSGRLIGKYADKLAESPRMQERMQKIAEIALRNRPVYSFKDDWKGYVARASLTGVEVKNQSVIAHVSFWQFTTTVLFSALIAVLSLVLAVGFIAALISSGGGGAIFFLF